MKNKLIIKNTVIASTENRMLPVIASIAPKLKVLATVASSYIHRIFHAFHLYNSDQI